MLGLFSANIALIAHHPGPPIQMGGEMTVRKTTASRLLAELQAKAAGAGGIFLPRMKYKSPP